MLMVADYDTPGPVAATSGYGLVGNAGALLGNRLLQAVLGWSGTVLIVRSLSMEDFGAFTLIFTVLALTGVVTDMGIGRLALRGLAGDDDRSPEDFAGAYFVLRSIMGVVGYLVSLAALWLGGYPREVVAATAIAGIVVLLATPSAALDVVFQSRLRLHWVGVMRTVGMMAQVGLTAALAVAGGALLWFVVPAVLAEAVILAWKIPAARRLIALRPRVDVVLWRAMLIEALPLAVGIGMADLYGRVDAIMLSKLDGFEAVGIYGVSYKFTDVMHFTSSAVTLPLLALLVTNWPHDPAAFRGALRQGTMLVGLLGGVGLMGLLTFADPLTTHLYGAEYAVGANATRVLALAEMLTLSSGIAVTALIAIGLHRRYPIATAFGLIVNVTLNLILIPRMGYLGAALATLVSNGIVVVLMWSFVARVPQIHPLGMARLVAVPVAVVAGAVSGLAADHVLPWVLAALLSCVIYGAVVVATGVTTAAGLSIRRQVRSA